MTVAAQPIYLFKWWPSPVKSRVSSITKSQQLHPNIGIKQLSQHFCAGSCLLAAGCKPGVSFTAVSESFRSDSQHSWQTMLDQDRLMTQEPARKRMLKPIIFMSCSR